MASVARRDAKRQIQQLTIKERNQIDDVMRKGTAADALRAVNAQRVGKNIREVEKSTVYRFAKGLTHKRGAAETRGRKRSLSKQNVRKLDTVRRRLIKTADNEKRITHADVIKEACLTDVACQRVCEDALRAEGVSFKAPRRKIQISEEDAKHRLGVAKVWVRHRRSYWSKSVHASFIGIHVVRRAWQVERCGGRSHVRGPSPASIGAHLGQAGTVYDCRGWGQKGQRQHKGYRG
jgi:hypothetical protein